MLPHYTFVAYIFLSQDFLPERSRDGFFFLQSGIALHRLAFRMDTLGLVG